MSPKSNSEPRRYITFDILRIFQLMPIAMLHAWEFMVGQDFVDESQLTTNYDTYRIYIGKYFNYSALYIVGISFFIWGLRDFKLKPWKVAILVFGIVGLQLQDPEKWFETAGWGWDLYSFLLIAVLLCRLIPAKKWVHWTIFAIGTIMLSVSINEWVPIASLTSRPWSTGLFARLDGNDVNGWFLIPWIFLPLMIFSMAKLVAESDFIRKPNVTKASFIVLSLLVASTICGFAKPDAVPPMLGVHFYQFLFMQSPRHFWQHYTLFLAVGLGLWTFELKSPQNFAPFIWLGRLQWNKNFFFCYFLHFAWFNQLSQHRDLILSHPYWLDYLWLFVIVLTEITAQIFFRALRFYPWVFKKFKKSKAVGASSSR